MTVLQLANEGLEQCLLADSHTPMCHSPRFLDLRYWNDSSVELSDPRFLKVQDNTRAHGQWVGSSWMMKALVPLTAHLIPHLTCHALPRTAQEFANAPVQCLKTSSTVRIRSMPRCFQEYVSASHNFNGRNNIHASWIRHEDFSFHWLLCFFLNFIYNQLYNVDQ